MDHEHLRALHDDVDLRAEEAFRLAWDDPRLEGVDQPALSRVVRVAYGLGYRDRERERVGRRPTLSTQHHVSIAR